MSAPSARNSGEGWMVFAGVLFLLLGLFNVMWAIAAFAADDDFHVDELLFGDLTLWGIWWLLMGALLLFTGLQIINRKSWGAALGISLAGLNAFTQLMFLGVYPAWSIAAMIVDGLIIYALATNYQEFDY